MERDPRNNLVEKLVEFASKRPEEKETHDTKSFHDSKANSMVPMLIHRALFRENAPLLSDISRDSWALYAYIKSESLIEECDNVLGLSNECLVKLVKIQPVKSYLRLSFHQFINFILNRTDGAYLVDIDYLMSFVSEIRTAYNTLCMEDRQLLRQTWKSANCDTSISRNNSDASFLVYWSTIEAAKYCICHKFAPDMTANEFLTLLQKEISLSVTLGNKVSRQFLVNFWHNLDKYILDRIASSSAGKYTFSTANTVEKFYEANCSTFRSWLLKNRRSIARLSLAIDYPAECWRNVNSKLWLDFGTSAYDLFSERPFCRNRMSLNTKSWHSSISLLTTSAKQLEDLPLLHGLQTLIVHGGPSCDYPPLSAIISNLEGHYEATYDLLKQPEDLGEQDLIEFLDACIELGCLDENIQTAERLKSPKRKELYKNYLRSKSQDTSMISMRVEELEHWFSTWTDITEEDKKTVIDAQPIRSYLDLIVPACLNIISKEPIDQRLPLVERVEWLISQDFIAQSLFLPNFINRNVKIFHILIELLKKETELPEDLVQTHAKDLYWNHSLYRHLCDLNLIEKLQSSSNTIELVQYRAAKFNFNHNNSILATKLAKNLSEETSSFEIKMLSSLLLIKDAMPVEDRCDALLKLGNQIEASGVEAIVKNDLISKVTRHIVRLSKSNLHSMKIEPVSVSSEDNLTQAIAGIQLPSGWRASIDCSSLTSRIKTFSLFSEHLEVQYESQPNNDELLNIAFNQSLGLLELSSQPNQQRHKSVSLICAARILHKVATAHKRLNNPALDKLSSNDFIVRTINVWIVLKSNLIALMFNSDLSEDWRNAMKNILKVIGKIYPNLLVYSIIMNKLDLQSDITHIADNCESSKYQGGELYNLLIETSTIRSSTDEQLDDKSRKLKNCEQRLNVWVELLDHIKTEGSQAQGNWPEIVADTESFLKEMRRISYLCGEYLKTLTATITKKLYGCWSLFSNSCDPESGIIKDKRQLEIYETRLKVDCDYAIRSVKILISYSNRVGESNLTKYDNWFYGEFTKQLQELVYRLSLLASKKPQVLSFLENLVKSITELLKMCRATLIEYNGNNRQKLYMELISPLLSRLNSSLIPMPDCCDQQLLHPDKPIVKISKISQTVNLVFSKTCPKKLKFLGSDGTVRPFLLKAHEDLRLDQSIMELFASINQLLITKETKTMYRIRRYSVTPISSQSGLIQWVEAPSLCSTYRAWLKGSNGKKMIEDLYSSTCESVCDKDIYPAKVHENCQPPQDSKMVDPFYQLLWAITKPLCSSIGQEKPHLGNIVKLRKELSSSIFQRVVKELSERTPKELLANQLWYNSNNAHSYWSKTQRFIRSCATMSIVGYIVGLGDRHLENILLDNNTGDLIHIDYNICFEMGKNLAIPEKVPFRLTQNIVYSFGFAGLKGGFTISCRKVLSILRDHKSTLLRLIDTIDLGFLLMQSPKPPKDALSNKLSCNLNSEAAVVRPSSSIDCSREARSHSDLEIFSQESVELKTPVNDVTDLLIMNSNPLATKIGSLDEVPVKPFGNGSSHSGSPHTLKATPKIQIRDTSILRERIKDKLNGSDEGTRRYENFYGPRTKDGDSQVERDWSAIDLILLNESQSVEDQVEGLIMEATLDKNRAEMFEGWSPWV